MSLSKQAARRDTEVCGPKLTGGGGGRVQLHGCRQSADTRGGNTHALPAEKRQINSAPLGLQVELGARFSLIVFIVLSCLCLYYIY